MNINPTSISQVYVSSQTSQVSSTNQDASQAADTPQVSGGHHHHHHSGGGGLMKAVQQALSQMGLNLDSQSSSSSQTATVTGTTGSTTSAAGISSTTENSQQALHAFMHDLFGALRATQDQANGTVGTVNSQGNNPTMSTQLQDVIQALGSSDASSLQNGPLSNLQPDFSSLVSSLGAGSSTNGAQTPDVQVFLQNLLQDQANGSADNGNSQFGSIQSGYPSDMTSQLQNVIQALGSSDSSSNQSSDLNKLQSDFSNLVSSLGGGNSGNTTQSQNLQVFLQNLFQNLPGQQTISPAVGSFVSTTV
jgi:hypothetical protein